MSEPRRRTWWQEVLRSSTAALSVFTYLALANGAGAHFAVAVFGACATGALLLMAADLGLWDERGVGPQRPGSTWLRITGRYVTCRCWKCGWGLAGERHFVMDEFTRHLELHR